MFYSRPDIEPLGWDLKELPVVVGPKNYLAMTIDGKIIGFRFSSGWLHVRYSEPGGTDNFFQMEKELYKKPIAPFGVMDILPEQLCDILGLTVQGQKVSYSYEQFIASYAGGGRYIDLSGDTIYWVSTHKFMPRDDFTFFVDSIRAIFPDVFLFQTVLNKNHKLRVRCLDFAIDTDEHIILAFGGPKTAREQVLENPSALGKIFPFKLRLSCREIPSIDPSGNRHIREKGALKYGAKFQTIRFVTYKLNAEYRADNDFAHKSMERVQLLLDEYFYKDLCAVNLVTGEILEDDVHGTGDADSYSQAMRNWCLEKSHKGERYSRYINVGVRNPNTNSDPVFTGTRPKSAD